MSDQVTAIETRTVETRTHGRYLVRPSRMRGASPLLVGFHGYRENAASHMAMLTRIAGTEDWLIAAVQGLHRFYSKNGEIAASWMTREDRELAIADNVVYVSQVVAAVRAEFPAGSVLAFAGFSQGSAMAFRAAGHVRANALLVAGGDVPADIAAGTPVPLPPVLYGRGRRDDLYSAEQHARDVATLERLGTPVESLAFDGGHELAPEFLSAAARTLGRLSPS